MTENYWRKRFSADHSRFGGLVAPSDFDTSYMGTNTDNQKKSSSIASRIASDMKFDEQCLRDAENRERGKLRANGFYK